MNDRAHFASDVVSGAIVGTLVGRSVVARHGPAEPSRLTLIPVSSAHGGFGIGARLLIGAKDDAALR